MAQNRIIDLATATSIARTDLLEKSAGGTGSFQITGQVVATMVLQNSIAKTGAYAFVAADVGGTFTNAGAAGSVALTLLASAANVGWWAVIIVAAAFQLQLVAQGSDKIYCGNLSSAAAGTLQSSTVGTQVLIECAASGIYTTQIQGVGTLT